jgi:ATP-binding cassette subfamily B protein
MAAAVAGAGLTVLIPAVTRRLLDECIPNNDLAGIIQNLLWMLMLIIITTVMSYIRVKWGHILGVRMEFDMRAGFFSHIQKLSFNYFDNVKTGHLMSRISNDLSQIAEVAHHAPEDLLISLVLIIGAFIAMFSFNVPLAAIAIIPIPFMISWGIFYGGSMRRGFRNVRKKIADINSRVENSVQGIREVKSYANEEEEIDKFDIVNVSFRSAKEKMYGIMAIFFSVMSLLIESYFFIVIAGGVILIHFGSEVTSVADWLILPSSSNRAPPVLSDSPRSWISNRISWTKKTPAPSSRLKVKSCLIMSASNTPNRTSMYWKMSVYKSPHTRPLPSSANPVRENPRSSR